MKKLFIILFALLIPILAIGQTGITGGYGWNYENRSVTTAKDSMAWANATLTIYYQVYPSGIYQYTAPAKSSRLWAGKGSVNRRTKLITVATAQMDNYVRYAVIKADSLPFGSWIRAIADDGTNKDTSDAVNISGGSKIMFFYYMEDVGTTLIRQYLKFEAKQ
jgi:hypothetical protein